MVRHSFFNDNYSQNLSKVVYQYMSIAEVLNFDYELIIIKYSDDAGQKIAISVQVDSHCSVTLSLASLKAAARSIGAQLC